MRSRMSFAQKSWTSRKTSTKCWEALRLSSVNACKRPFVTTHAMRTIGAIQRLPRRMVARSTQAHLHADKRISRTKITNALLRRMQLLAARWHATWILI